MMMMTAICVTVFVLLDYSISYSSVVRSLISLLQVPHARTSRSVLRGKVSNREGPSARDSSFFEYVILGSVDRSVGMFCVLLQT